MSFLQFTSESFDSFACMNWSEFVKWNLFLICNELLSLLFISLLSVSLIGSEYPNQSEIVGSVHPSWGEIVYSVYLSWGEFVFSAYLSWGKFGGVDSAFGYLCYQVIICQRVGDHRGVVLQETIPVCRLVEYSLFSQYIHDITCLKVYSYESAHILVFPLNDHYIRFSFLWQFTEAF